MRRTLSIAVLLTAVAASVATSKKKTPTPSVVATALGPAVDVGARHSESFSVDLLATQAPAGPFDGAVILTGDVSAEGAATVTATLSVTDPSGTTELARDTVAVAQGSARLQLFDDLGAFSACAEGATCDQTFVVQLHTTGDAHVEWSIDAELYGSEHTEHTGELSLHLR